MCPSSPITEGATAKRLKRESGRVEQCKARWASAEVCPGRVGKENNYVSEIGVGLQLSDQ